uniref:Phospholipid phosphatase-related protein type 3 n=1 Tax=Tetraodon nigroviridis TaxID=99883 RepID=H3CCI4_TETNG
SPGNGREHRGLVMNRAKERLKGGNDTKDSVTLLPCFYFVEISSPILASSVVSLYFLELTDIFQPVHSGYSCNDRSLSLPYVLPRQELCPLPLLFSLAFAAPTATILVGEAILYCYLSRRSSSARTEANINAAGCNFNSYIRRAVRFIGVHIFGLCVTALITDILQLSTGQHAPYWLDVCKPNLTHLNLSSCDEAFILEDICSGADSGLITAGRKSFPSQHATLSAFAAVYISMYFNTVLTDSAKLLKPLLVFTFAMLAILAGLTRIIQFRNHPVDVYCGWMLGAAIALYLGVYAVGNFQPSEDRSRSRGRPLPLLLREPPLSSLPNVSQSALSNSHPVRSASYREPSLSNLKRASAEVEVMAPSSPLGNHDGVVTFSSSTLPRSHGGSSFEEGRVPRRHASIHTSMDSTRSKQLLSQWKNKNDNRKLSLQVMDGIRPACSSSPQRNMELRCSSEPSAMGLEAEDPELRAEAHIPAQYMKLAASSVPMANHNHLALNGSGGMPAGARVSLQSRPGSSQLVHIPEEENLNIRDQESESEDSIMDGGSVREKWLRAAEKTSIPCRPLSAGGQPRLMQVITLSKQQGLLHSPRSEDGGSVRYRALTDQDPSPIVRVEAHPEARKPVVKPPSTDGSGSWRWKPPEQRASLRHSTFALNDLNRHTDSSDSLDGRRSVTNTEPESHHQHQGDPVEGGMAAGSDGGSDCQSAASSSRESTLRRKSGLNALHLAERSQTQART